MADDDFCIWDEGADLISHGLDGSYAIMEEEGLSAALHLAGDGGADDALVVAADGCLDGYFIRRCGVYGGHVSGAHEGEVEGAGYGGGGEGEEVYAVEEFFEFFFMFYSEALFFIYDCDSEVFEVDVI